MIRRRRGLIAEVTEGNTLMAGGIPLPQTVKLALKGLVFNVAAELKPRGIAAIALARDFVRSCQERSRPRRRVPADDRLVNRQGRPSASSIVRRDGGRAWWAHFEFTRINIEPTILRKKIEDLREADATLRNAGAVITNIQLTEPHLIVAAVRRVAEKVTQRR
jgi:hypothetical protein